MGTLDVTVRLQALSGAWETCGADRAIQVVPESEQHTHDAWGPKTASFTLKRTVIALWPDLSAFTPVEIEIGGVIVWEGSISETPVKSGPEQTFSVECEGWQAQLDDDVYERTYVHSKLTDWKDIRSQLTADLTAYVAAPQVQVGNGQIAITWPAGTAAKGTGAAVLDMGPSTLAKRVVISWSATAGSAGRSLSLGWGSESGVAAAAETIYTGTGASSGVFAFTLPTESRYLFIAHNQAGATPAADETMKIINAIAFASTTYETGNASVLLASMIVKDALERATLLLSNDMSGINTTAFHIPDFVMSKLSTAREVIEAANAFQNWIFKLGLNRRPLFYERPTAPTLEIGSWSEDDVEDTSANSGAEIYNRAIVEGEGPEGSPILAERTAAQQPTAVATTPTSPAVPNPSFTAGIESWGTVKVGGATIALFWEKSVFNTPPGSLGVSINGNAAVFTDLTGTFKKGIPYHMSVALMSNKPLTLLFGSGPDFTAVGVTPPTGSFQVFACVWTPRADTSTAVFEIAPAVATGPTVNFNVDDVTLQVIQPTLLDRRGRRRTKVIQMSSAITPAVGERVADLYLQSHMTTPFKGTASATHGDVRRVLGGQLVHPSQIGLYTQELIRCSNLTDPDTGGIGRDGTIAEVSYTHAEEKATITLDDKRGNFEALLSRLAAVQVPGS